MYLAKDITTKCIYNEFITILYQQPACIAKWEKDYPDFFNKHDSPWPEIYMMGFNICRETYLQAFQYKILNRIINCQKKLFDWKLAQNSNCLYCSGQDTILHFFLFCHRVDNFWNNFFNWWNSLGDIQIPTTVFENLEESIIFGFQTKGG